MVTDIRLPGSKEGESPGEKVWLGFLFFLCVRGAGFGGLLLVVG